MYMYGYGQVAGNFFARVLFLCHWQEPEDFSWDVAISASCAELCVRWQYVSY